jgi:hypothetical protein
MRPAAKRSAHRVETSLYELLTVAQELTPNEIEASRLVQQLLDHSKVRLVRRPPSVADNDTAQHRQAA